MGNTSHINDTKLMREYSTFQKDFRSEVPLYDAEQITFPLSTSNTKIVDRTGRRVKISGGNWSGGHMKRHCVGGLDNQPIGLLCKNIRSMFDLNCVRLTFSLQMFFTNNVVDRNLILANPQLWDKTAMEIFDITIQELTSAGVMVLLNNHTSTSQWCCSTQDGDGLWHTKDYPQDKFFACLVAMAKRYSHNPRVIGMDLRNQIRHGYGGEPTWGDGNHATDWKLAAETAGNKILEVAPHWLIVVGGINFQLDLTGVFQHPVKLNVPNKLIYSGHFYGFSWPLYPWLIKSSQAFREKIFNEQLYVRSMGVPFLLGEFGGNSQDKPWTQLNKLLYDQDLDWMVWCLDGYKCDKKEDETFGLWDYTFTNPRNPSLVADIKRIGRPKMKATSDPKLAINQPK